ncbi:hypothetical protein Tsubulata_047373 [Turnera subulata]|uniref:Zinc knuckle CX2CX4HX4C domain-containing protein n=1 Tax=Turnera subulata TaxID=218843 RepID=A0A9Q0G7H5_9ROSI|nr:hypothetical protein Tsubulata_047373 [Turnera subulata]
MHDVPSDLSTISKIVRRGNAFPIFLYYEHSLENVLGWQGFVSARIEFLFIHPLRPGVHVLDTEGKEIWLKFKYERLGEFCFRCGVILHPTFKCKNEKRPNEGKELPEDDSYGPWIWAREVYGKHYSGQKSFTRTTQQAPLDAADASGDWMPPQEDAEVRTPMDTQGKMKYGTDPSLSPITEAAQKHHKEVVHTVAQIVEELDTNTPVQNSAAKPS